MQLITIITHITVNDGECGDKYEYKYDAYDDHDDDDLQNYDDIRILG